MRFEFSDCALDLEARTLRRQSKEIAVEPQVFDILHLLADRAGKMVTKDELIDAVWEGRIVSDATISARISTARAAVGDSGNRQTIIRTVSRRGFQMVAKVVRTETPDARPASPSAEQVIRYTSSPDGASIAWSRAGDGPPVLYAWHHLSHLEQDWTSRILRPGLAALSERHSLIRYDIRGAGLSDPIPAEPSLDNHVMDMKAVADAAGLERFPIVATLQSAAVAIRFAALFPDRVSRLVLHNAYARGRALRAGAPDIAENDPFIALLKSGGWGDPENGFMRAWTTMVLPMASQEETTELIRLIAHSGPAEAALHHRTMIDRLDVSDDLQRVNAPTRVIHSRLNPIHPVAEGRRVAAGIPSAEFVEVDSSNTIFIGSDPVFQRVMASTLEFLAQGGPS
ncbi:MAG: alpha/beta fold hydrolase [Paracoccaceae bacterium]|nr:alpha/beta fold hydrolase [Paracoccaceae bacterium]